MATAAKKANKETFELIDIAAIIPSGDNPRTINIKSEPFIELLDSIKAIGVIVPVHVRTHPKKKDKYELLAGERRFVASKTAGLINIKAINHGDITDEEAFDITVAENFAREDLTPLEHGKAVSIMLEKYQGDANAVAAKLGKPIGWVRLHSMINSKLCKEWKAAISNESNTGLTNWTSSHFASLCKAPAAIQLEMLEEIKEDNGHYGGGEFTNAHKIKPKDIEQMIMEASQLLRLAPWKPDDDTLVPKAGACDKCPKCTAAQPELFDLDTKNASKDNRCLDPECWGKKMDAFLQAKRAEYKEKYPNLLTMAQATDWQLKNVKEFIEKYGKEAVSSYEYTECRKDDKKAVPVFVVHGKGIGKLRWVRKLGSSCNESPKKTKTGPKPLKVRSENLNSKRWCGVLAELKEILRKTEVTGIVITKDLPLYAILLIELVNRFGVEVTCDPYTSKQWNHFDKNINVGTFSEESISELWEHIKPRLLQLLHWNGGVTQLPKERIDHAKNIAGLIGFDIEQCFENISKMKGFTEPKAWASLNADGTQKKTKDDKAAKPVNRKKAAKKTVKKAKK